MCNKECKSKANFDLKKYIYINPNYLIILTGLIDNNNYNNNYLNSFDMNNKDRLIFTLKDKIEPNDLGEILINKKSRTEYKLTGFIVYNYDKNVKENCYYISYYVNPIDKCWYKYDKDNIGKIDE